jgi:hypothetical protein
MQRHIKQWGRDQVINVGRLANLYKTMKRLREAGHSRKARSTLNRGGRRKTAAEMAYYNGGAWWTLVADSQTFRLR